MIKRIIIAHLYNPGSAATNRIIAYASGFHKLRLDVILILGMSKQMAIPQLSSGIKIVECLAVHNKLNYLMSNKVKDYYQTANTVVMIYGSPAMCWYLPKSKYNIFYECTEVPFYGRKKTVIGWVKESIKNLLAKRATGMLVISNSLADYFREKGIKNIAIVNMFVDVDRFNQLTTTNEEKYVAYCGTISPFKDGVDILLKAFSLFIKSHPGYELKLIGKFESKEAELYLKKLIKELDIDESVQFTGMIKPEKMPSLLCGALMLALARPNNEQAKFGFPTKLGEYLATGKPVVVTDVGEIGDFLKDMYNCRMANPDDEIDFAEKMNWVVEHYEEALILGGRGKDLTQSEFSCQVQCKVALDFMESHLSL